MVDRPIRMLFLGERRIASSVLQMFLSKYRSSDFEIVGVVSSRSFFEANLRSPLSESIQFLPNSSRETDAILDLIATNNVNMLLSVQHNWILEPEVLAACGALTFNLHNAELPRYKGFNTVSHAIFNGDSTYTSTLHWMDRKVDSGDIAFEEKSQIDRFDTALSLYEKTIPVCVSLAEKLFSTLDAGLMPPRRPLDISTGGTFYSRDSLKKILKVEIGDPPLEITRKVRAGYYPPANNAYMVVDGLRVELIPAVGR